MNMRIKQYSCSLYHTQDPTVCQTLHIVKCCLLPQAQQDALADGTNSWMTPLIKLETDAGIKQIMLGDLDVFFKHQGLPWGGTHWAKACIALRDSILTAMRGHLNTDVYLHELRQFFNAPFEASVDSQLKLKRFPAVHSLLVNELLPSIVKQTLSKRLTKLEDMVDALFGSHFNLFGKSFHDDEFEVLQHNIEAYTIHQMLAHMSSLGDHGIIPPDFQLTEDANTAAARTGLEVKVEKLKAARQSINELAGLPAWQHSCKGSYARIATADSKLGGNGMDGSYCFTWPGNAVSAALDKLPAPSLTVSNEERLPENAAGTIELELMIANSPQQDSSDCGTEICARPAWNPTRKGKAKKHR